MLKRLALRRLLAAFGLPLGRLLADSGRSWRLPWASFRLFFLFWLLLPGALRPPDPPHIKKYVKDLAKTGESKQNHLKSNVNLKAHNHKADAIGRRSLLKHGGRRSSRRKALLDPPATSQDGVLDNASAASRDNIPFSFPNSVSLYFTLPYVEIRYPKSFQKPSTLKTLTFNQLPAPPL